MNEVLLDRFRKVGINVDLVKSYKPFWNRTVCHKCIEDKPTKDRDMSFNMTTGGYICHKCQYKGGVLYEKKTEYSRPTLQDNKPSDDVKTYFFGRGISEKVFDSIVQRKLLSYSKTGAGFYFNYWREGVLINYKARSIADKKFYQHQDAEKILFNIDSAKGKTKAILVEGEMSAYACIEAGLESEYAVLSLENGAAKEGSVDGKLIGLRNCYEQLAKIETWIIALDNDQAGVYTANEVIKYLGAHKCKIVVYPENCKDPDDIINRHKRGDFTGPQNNAVLSEMINTAVDFPIRGIIKLDDNTKALLMSYKKYGRPPAIKIPMLDNHFSFKRGDLTVLSGYANMGKALCLNTEIPTPSGFVKISEIKPGDVVFDEKGDKCNVIAISDVFRDRNCYELTFSDNSTVVCDEQHEWTVYSSAARASEARQKKRNPFLAPKGTDQRHKTIKPETITTRNIIDNFWDTRGRIQYSVNLCGAVKYREQELKIHPYLLGYWLGDGTKDSSEITTADIDIIKAINKLRYKAKKRKTKKYGYIVKGLVTNLREVGVFKNKHIPDDYLRSSAEQRLDLLRGLMDSDGYTGQKRGEMCEFCSTNKKLAYHVYELICSLGIKATIKESDAKLYGRVTSKRYRIRFKTDISCFSLKRKKKAQDCRVKCKYRHIKSFRKVQSVPTKCISVDSPTNQFLCTRSFIPTHNSTWAMNLAYLTLMEYQWKWGIFAGEQHPQDRYFEDLAHMVLKKPVMDKDNWGKPIEGCATPEEYEAALEFISNHVYLIYPERGQKPTFEWIKEKASFLKTKYGVNGIILDTFNKMKHDFANQRDDVYLDDWLDLAIEDALEYDAYLLLMHPSKPQKTRSGQIAMMNMYDLHGGAMTANKVDNIMIYHRDSRFGEDQVPNNGATIRFDKIRDQKTVGRIGEFKVIYDPHMNGFRYGPSQLRFNRSLDTVTHSIIKSAMDDIEAIAEEDIPF